MAIQMRRGANSDFNPSKMLPGEIAVTTDGTRKVYAAFRANDVKELASQEDVQGLINRFTSVVDREIAEAEQRIESKGQQVLETIPDLYEEVSARADEAVRTKADAIVCTVSGVNPIAKDSSNDYLRNLKLYGKTTQGENPSPNNPQPLDSKGKWGNYLKNEAISQTIEGITYTVNSDKSVRAKGTATGDSIFAINASAIGWNLKPKKYNLSGCPSNGFTGGKINLQYWGNATGGVQDFGSGAVLDLTGADTSYNVSIVIPNGVTIDATFYPMIVDADSGITEYRPYSEQKEVENGVYGKNFLNHKITSKTKNGIIITVNEDKSLTLNGTCTGWFFENFDYINANTRTLDSGNYILSGAVYDNVLLSVFVDGVQKGVDNGQGVKFEITSETVTNYSRFEVFDGAVLNNVTIYPMIRRAEITDGTYEPYTKQSHISLVGDGLKGIPVTDASLATYTDENGQMWCSDYVDCERGVLVQRIGTLSLGSNMLFWSALNGNKRRWLFILKDMQIDSLSYSQKANVMCDRAESVSWYKMENNVGNYIATLYIDGTTNVGVSFTEIQNITTESEFKAWLAENPMTVQYILATPIETPLSADEIASFKALHSNYKVTSVMNDCEAFTEFSYNADTKTYIDNKFAALAAQLV